MGAGAVVAAAVVSAVVGGGTAVVQARQQRKAQKREREEQAAKEKAIKEEQARAISADRRDSRISKLRQKAGAVKRQTQLAGRQTFGAFPTTAKTTLLGGDRGTLG